MGINPILVVLALAGIGAAFRRPELKPARFIAIAFVFVLAVQLSANGRAYYVAGGYPALFAIGGVVAVRLPVGLLRTAVALALVLSLAGAPFAYPVLPPHLLLRYWSALHGMPAPDRPPPGYPLLRPLVSDEFGWRELVRQVGDVYRGLPPEDLGNVAILAWSISEAAAIDFYGPAEGLPAAISGHNQFYFWGPRGATGKLLIVINGDPRSWRPICGDLAVAAVVDTPYVSGNESQLPIVICRDFRLGDLSTEWYRFKNIH